MDEKIEAGHMLLAASWAQTTSVEANGTESWVNIWNGSGKKAASKGLVATHGFFILTTTH